MDKKIDGKFYSLTDREALGALAYLWGRFEGDKEFMDIMEKAIDIQIEKRDKG